jgi:hypothetical protein
MVDNLHSGKSADPTVLERHRELALLSVIMPTFNEHENVGRMHFALGDALAGIPRSQRSTRASA